MRVLVASVLGVVLLFSSSAAANADPGDVSTESQTRNSEFGDFPLTAGERRVTALRQQQSGRFVAELAMRDAATRSKRPNGPITSYYEIYEEVSVPTYQQEQPYWCGPATNKQILATPRINRVYAQSTLASEMGTTEGGTYVGAMRNNLNNHTIYDPNVAPNMPANWIWIAVQPGNVSNFVSLHREDLSYNLPSVFNPRGRHPNGTLYLIGWTSDGGHYVAGAGYREDQWALVSDVKYVDPYQNPNTGTSLGRHWMNAGSFWSLVAANTGYIIQ
ncbi:MAG: C39 family peptidase [Gammaproteobacteria bacterium]